MNLPFINKFNKKILPSYFLVLVLRDEKAQAVIFEEIQGVVKIVGQREEHFSSSIDDVSPDEFLDVLDKAISQAESTLPENIQTQKTIFGVKENWTEADQIRKNYLAKLKNASQELGLTPIGFLVNSQAIAHLLQKEEGAPVSAILAEVNKKTVTVTLLRAGKSIETKSSEIHESIPFTVDALLKHFNIPEILPSRIIIFNGKEDLSQEFISHTWSKSLPFLHLPQITNLPEGFDAKSVLFGAATQMGFEVARKDIPQEPRLARRRLPEEKIPEENVLEESPPAEGPTQKKEAFQNIGASNFGFAKDMDVAKMEFKEPPARIATQSIADREEIPQINEEEEFPTKAKSAKGFNNILAQLKGVLILILGGILMLAKKINVKNILSVFTKIPKGKTTLILSGILFLIIALIVSYFLFIKAIIAVTIDPKITQKVQNVLFSTKTNTDQSQSIIRGDFINVSEDGNVSTAPTGKKDVGANAKGTVTIFNNSDITKTLPAGTIITSSNNLDFALSDNVTVASASGDVFLGTTPGKANVNVIASKIGTEYNLPSNIKFSFAGSSSIAAKNDNPFSGGTKKQVTVVSKDDQTKLETDLTKQLEDKAKSELAKEIGENKILLPSFVSTSLSKESLNTKIGDEATQVTLTGTVNYQAISYDKNDLIAFSKSLLQKDVASDQEIDYNNIKTEVKDLKSKNDQEAQATLNIKALLLPKIDNSKLLKDIKGKSFKSAHDLIYKLPQVSNVNISLSPNIPFLPKTLPTRESNIKILIKING